MFYAIAVVLVLIADQALKYWVSLNIDLNTGEQALIPGFIKLVNIHNSGAAFGLLGGGGWRWVFVVVALVFAVVVVYALKRDLIRGKLGRWAAVGVLAGSIGNCIDRVAYGYVVDMFKFEFLGDSRLNAIFFVFFSVSFTFSKHINTFIFQFPIFIFSACSIWDVFPFHKSIRYHSSIRHHVFCIYFTYHKSFVE